MNTRPIYRSLLEYLSEKELADFMRELVHATDRVSPVTLSDEVDSHVMRLSNNGVFPSALTYAAHLSNVSVVRALLSIGADPNVHDSGLVEGTPLLAAVRNVRNPRQGKEANEIVDLLLQANADIYVRCALKIPLHLACSNAPLLLRLLATDEIFECFILEAEKTAFIKQIRTSHFQHLPPEVLYNTVGKVHLRCDKAAIARIGTIINETCQFGGAPLEKKVLSYLFRDSSPTIKTFMQSEKFNPLLEEEKAEPLPPPNNNNARRSTCTIS